MSRYSLRLVVPSAVVSAVILVVVARLALTGQVSTFDRAVSSWFYGIRSPALVALAKVFTFLGSLRFIGFLVVIAVASAIWKKANALAVTLVLVVLASKWLNALVKPLFQRSRPDLFSETAVPSTYSFPSSHAMVSIAAYGMLALVVARLRPALRLPAYVATTLLVMLIGISRILLGVHWATDVLGGFAAGAMLLLAGRIAIGRFSP